MPSVSQTKTRPSSYRRAFGSQTNYSTAGTVGRREGGNKDRAQSLQDITGAAKLPESYSVDDVKAMYAAAKSTHSPNQQLGSLNNRFASYIEKVRFLEEQNKILELKIKQAQKRKSEMEQNRDKDNEIKELRVQIDHATMVKVKMQVERDNLKGDAVELSHKLEDELQLRIELDEELQRMRKDVDDATMVRVDLERKIEGLREELDYGRKVRHEESADLKQQIEEQGISVEVDGITPDMNQILGQIRQEYDEIAVKNRDEAEQWYKKKCDDLEDKARGNEIELEKVSAEMNEYRKQVTQLEMELESLRGTNEYLERNLAEVEKRYEMEVNTYQGKLNKVGGELDKATNDMKRHLAEYKNLMNVKLSLEKEIDVYRSLLEGEEGRISTVGSSESSHNESSDTEAEDNRQTLRRKTQKIDFKPPDFRKKTDYGITITKKATVKTVQMSPKQPPKIPDRRGSSRFDELMSVTETGTSILTSSDSSDSSDSDSSTDSSEEESV